MKCVPICLFFISIFYLYGEGYYYIYILSIINEKIFTALFRQIHGFSDAKISNYLVHNQQAICKLLQSQVKLTKN